MLRQLFSSSQRLVRNRAGHTATLRRVNNNFNFKQSWLPRTPLIVGSFQIRPRYYSEAHKLTYDEVRDRVIKVVQGFDKIDPNIVTATSSFQKDLGIDSLDAVELVMALEDEFVIQIPDEEAEKITSCEEAINFISTHPHAK